MRKVHVKRLVAVMLLVTVALVVVSYTIGYNNAKKEPQVIEEPEVLELINEYLKYGTIDEEILKNHPEYNSVMVGISWNAEEYAKRYMEKKEKQKRDSEMSLAIAN